MDRIVPFFSKNCVVTPKKEEQKNARYQRIVFEAAKQCGRGKIPCVSLPLTFSEVLREQSEYDLSLFCYEENRQKGALHSRLVQAKRLAVITGAEGGFTPSEAEAAKAVCNSIGLGERILRCETAPIAALSVVMALTGNLGEVWLAD